MGSNWQLPLTDNQKLELDKSVVEYIKWNFEHQAAAQNGNNSDDVSHVIRSLSNLFSISEESSSPSNAQLSLLLPRKWNSIVRLQRRIMVLEQSCKDLTTQLQSKSSIVGNEKIGNDCLDWLPRQIPNHTITVDSSISAIKIHPQFPIVFIGTEYGKLYAFDMLNYTIPLASLQAHTKGITSIDVLFLNDNTDSPSTFICTGSKDLQVRVFKWSSASSSIHLQLTRSFLGHEHIVSGVKIWQKHKEILVASCSRDLSIKIWDMSNGWCIKTFQPHSDWIRTFDIIGDYILSGSQDSSLRLTHWPSGNGLSIGSGHEFPIESVKIIPFLENDENIKYRSSSMDEYNKMEFEYCVSASRDRTIKIWQIPLPTFIPHRPPIPNVSNSNFKCVFTFHGHQSWVRDIHIRGSHLFSCSDDKTVRCWDLSTGKCVQVWENIHSGFVNCMDLDSDTSLLKREISVTGGIDCKCNIFIR